MQKILANALFVGAMSFPMLVVAQGTAERSTILPPPTPPPAETLPPAPLVSDETSANPTSAADEGSAVSPADIPIEPLTPVTNPLPLLIVIVLAILLIIGGGWFLYKRGGKV